MAGAASGEARNQSNAAARLRLPDRRGGGCREERVLLNEGKENPTLKAVWAGAPKAEGPEVTVAGTKLNPVALLPKSLNYYSFEGSLTTPPCGEGVTFYILKSPVPMAKAQIDGFPFKMNARPVQPLNGRKIAAN